MKVFPKIAMSFGCFMIVGALLMIIVGDIDINTLVFGGAGIILVILGWPTKHKRIDVQPLSSNMGSVATEKPSEEIKMDSESIPSTSSFDLNNLRYETSIPDDVPEEKKMARYLFWFRKGRSLPESNDDYPRYFLYDLGISEPLKYHHFLVDQGYLSKDLSENSLKKLTVNDLREVLQKNGISISGKKANLIQRIMEENLNTDIPVKRYVWTDKAVSFARSSEYYMYYDYGLGGIPFEQFHKFLYKNRDEKWDKNTFIDEFHYSLAIENSKDEYKAIKSLNGKKYEISATLDIDTCDVCGELDGKVFDINSFKIGVTAPPFHRGCRCMIMPANDWTDLLDDDDEPRTRAARDPKTNKTVYVPDMKYTEWKNKIIAEIGQDEWNVLRTK